MKKHIKALAAHPLISGSGIIFIGSFTVNVFNFLFNLGMARFLPVASYGLLISLIALISLLTLFQTSLTSLFTKFAASYAAKNDVEGEASFIWTGTKITLVIGALSMLVLIFLIVPLSNFLHVNNVLLMGTVYACVFMSILYTLPSGVLQGNLKFVLVSVTNIIGAIGKVTVGAILVLSGLSVIGAVFGVLFSFITPYIISLVYILRKYNIVTRSEAHVHFISELKKVSGPFLAASVAITILQGTDVILARHFLSTVAAGQFAALSLTGKAIFYLTSPIYFVFFPLIAHKKEKKEKTKNTLLLAGGIIFGISLFFTVFYFIFPQLVLHIFFPSPEYKILTEYVGLYSLYVLIFSLCFLLFNYFLSMGKTDIYKINWCIAVCYVLLIFFFHKNIFEFIVISILSSFLLLCFFLVYYWRYEAH